MDARGLYWPKWWPIQLGGVFRSMCICGSRLWRRNNAFKFGLQQKQFAPFLSLFRALLRIMKLSIVWSSTRRQQSSGSILDSSKKGLQFGHILEQRSISFPSDWDAKLLSSHCLFFYLFCLDTFCHACIISGTASWAGHSVFVSSLETCLDERYMTE